MESGSIGAIWVTTFLDNGGYMKCESCSALDYIKEIVIWEAEVYFPASYQKS